MKIILVGYPGSQSIIRATRYLLEKYMPGFDLVFCNHEGSIDQWSKAISDYLKTIDDKNVILTLDDYFLNAPTDMDKFAMALDQMNENVSIKLCDNTAQEFNDYPISTQYTIWNREFLIKLLAETTDPWNFEIHGSSVFKKWGAKSLCIPCMSYNVLTALSKRWLGVSLKGLSYPDVLVVKGLLSQ